MVAVIATQWYPCTAGILTPRLAWRYSYASSPVKLADDQTALRRRATNKAGNFVNDIDSQIHDPSD